MNPTKDELIAIIKAHREWLDEGIGVRADLSRANLSRANLSGANLSLANLGGANLIGANLGGGFTWERYLSDLVPMLLTAGGKSLTEVLATGCWECHEWFNCPMHAAFGAASLSDIPILYRVEAERFIQFFDAKLIHKPTIVATAPARGEAV